MTQPENFDRISTINKKMLNSTTIKKKDLDNYLCCRRGGQRTDIGLLVIAR